MRKKIALEGLLMLFCILFLFGTINVTSLTVQAEEVLELEEKEENVANSPGENKEGMPQIETEDNDVEQKEKIEEEEKPIIHCETLTIDKTEAVVGDVLTFRVKVSDDTGIEKVIIGFENVDNNSSISYKKMTYNAERGFYEYQLKIDENTVAGHWTVDSIGAYDLSENYEGASYLFDNKYGMWDFYVANQEIDSEAPVIERDSLFLDKTEAIVGDKIIFGIKVTDNESISEVKMTLKNEDKDKSYYKEMQYNEKSGLYEYIFEFPDNTFIGHWSLHSIRAEDKSGNNSYESYWLDSDVREFLVMETEEGLEYECDVIEKTLQSGKEEAFSCKIEQGKNLRIRIFDDSVIGTVWTGREISTENGATYQTELYKFTPFREGKTTVEIYDYWTDEIYWVYKIEVVPGEYKGCIDEGAKVSFLSTVDQGYSATDEKNETVDIELVEKSGIAINGRGQYQYTYLVKSSGERKRRIMLVGNVDKKKIIANLEFGEHIFAEPKFVWSDDKSSCDAVFKCDICDKEEKIECKVIPEKVKEETCTQEGKIRYKATCLFNGKEYKEEELIKVPVKPHEYKEPRAEWGEDYSSCEFVFECKTCGDSVRVSNSGMNSSQQDPVCGVDGVRTYEAFCWFEEKEYSAIKEEKLPALQHQYTYRVSAEGMHVLVCDFCQNMKEEEECTIKDGVCIYCGASRMTPYVRYRSHVQTYGDTEWVYDSMWSGTQGESKRMESIYIELENLQDLSRSGVEYQAHVQKKGWMNWVRRGELAGTTGESLRIEAIRIRLTGLVAKQYDVYYRVHAQQFGWLGWAKNGEAAGTAGYSYRLEAFEVRLVPKGENPPENSGIAEAFKENLIEYSVHVQKIGDQDFKKNGEFAGTTGKSYRLESIRINLPSSTDGSGVEYRTHAQTYGWMDWKKNGERSGTWGESKRLEAIQIRLTGALAKRYNIYYCVHVQNIGWLNWAENGQSAGTAGYSYRLEGIKIQLLPKGANPPKPEGNASESFVQR